MPGDRTTVVEGPAPLETDSHKSRLEPGTQVGDHIVDGYVSEGGFASVYRAHRKGADTPVALKVMHPEQAAQGEFVLRFKREAETIRGLEHPNIVRIDELGSLDDGRPFLAMEWLEGHTLKDEIAQSGPFAPEDAVAILEALASALGAAHAAGVIHRDVKASNVMLIPDGPSFTIKLLDFGIAKLLEDESALQLTRTGVRIGTPATMAPEQLLCQDIDCRTDVYGSGLLFYQLVTGSLPFSGETWIEYEQLHIYSPRPRPSQSGTVPAALDRVILKSLEPSRDDRFASMEAMALAARRALRRLEDRPDRSLGIHIQVEFTSDEPSDAALDAADDVLESMSSHLSGAGMSTRIELADSLLMTTVLPGDGSRLQGKLASMAVRLLDDVERGGQVRASIRLAVSGGDAGIDIDDPRTWRIPRQVGAVTCHQDTAASMTETVLESPVGEDAVALIKA